LFLGLIGGAQLAKMGRPKSDEPRKNAVMVRFTDNEFKKLKKCAEEDNLTIAETVRNKALKQLETKQ